MPGDISSEFSVFKLADLNDDMTNSGDIRFFYEPSIVRAFITETLDSGEKDIYGNAIIVKQKIPYDAVLIGSGDRSNPLGTDTDDVFYMIKDVNIETQQFTSSSPTPTPKTIGDLYNYTDNPFNGLTGIDFDAKAFEVSLKSGWYFNFEQSGEKSSASPLVLNGVVYFTSFTPPDLSASSNSSSCQIESGGGWLYAVNLALGTKKYNWLTEDNAEGLNREDRIARIGDGFPDKPTLVVIDHDDDPTTPLKSYMTTDNIMKEVDLGQKTSRFYLTVDERL